MRTDIHANLRLKKEGSDACEVSEFEGMADSDRGNRRIERG
jgi:hypothetical protein